MSTPPSAIRRVVNACARSSNASLCRSQIEGLDVTDEHQIERIVAAIVATEGRIDVLVNNAGVPGVAAALEEIDETVGSRRRGRRTSGRRSASPGRSPAHAPAKVRRHRQPVDVRCPIPRRAGFATYALTKQREPSYRVTPRRVDMDRCQGRRHRAGLLRHRDLCGPRSDPRSTRRRRMPRWSGRPTTPSPRASPMGETRRSWPRDRRCCRRPVLADTRVLVGDDAVAAANSFRQAEWEAWVTAT